jgi:hypothetical protein
MLQLWTCAASTKALTCCTVWPDEIVNKWPKMRPNPFFVKISAQLLPRKKTNFGGPLFKFFFKKLPKENNRPMGEKSPNPVTLSLLRIFLRLRKSVRLT